MTEHKLKLDELIPQLKSCGYECEAGKLECNIAFIEDKSDACAEATIWAISEFMKPEHELYLAILRNKMRLSNDP